MPFLASNQAVSSVGCTATSRGRMILVVAATATTLGALHAAKLGLPHSFGGADADLGVALVRSLGIWWLWAMLAPVAFAVSRRCHPWRVGIAASVAAHLAGAILLSVLHSVVYVPVMLAVIWPDLLADVGAVWQRNIVGNVTGDMLTYATIACAWYAYDSHGHRRAGHEDPAVSALTAKSTVLPRIEQAAATEKPAWLSRIPVRAGNRLHLVSAADVDWVEASGDYAVLHCGGRRYLTNERIGSLAGALDPAQFIRIHRSAIARVDRIRELRRRTHGDYDVVFADGRTARLSRTYRDSVAAALRVQL